MGHRVEKFFHGDWVSAGFSWVVRDRCGDVVSGPDRLGSWAQSFKTRLDAEHAARSRIATE